MTPNHTPAPQDELLSSHFKTHINTYADKHPMLLVRQLASALREQLAATPAAALAAGGAEAITVQEAWEAAGGSPGVKATKQELLEALRQLDKVCDEADAPAVPPGLVLVDKRDLFDAVRSAYFNGANSDGADEAALRSEAHDYASRCKLLAAILAAVRQPGPTR